MVRSFSFRNCNLLASLRRCIIANVLIAKIVSANYYEDTYSCYELDPTSTYTCPTFRYCTWMTLPYDYQKTFSKKLGYTMLEWDYVLINDIEKSSYVNLDKSYQKNLLKAGYTQETHDCCNNHYEDFTWASIESDHSNVLNALKTLGYDEESWDSSSRIKRWSTDDGYVWENTPEEIQYALHELCHTRETWSGFPITTWPKDSIILPGQIFPPPTPAPTVSSSPTNQFSQVPSSQPTPLHSNKPSLSPTFVHSPVPTLKPSVSPSNAPTLFHSSAPTDEPSVNPTEAPTSVPSLSPTSTPSVEPSISFEPTISHSPTQSAIPSRKPSSSPSVPPTGKPSQMPSLAPTTTPSIPPSDGPTLFHSSAPTDKPSTSPSQPPTMTPSTVPSNKPTLFHSAAPTGKPSSPPSTAPSGTPSSTPTDKPTSEPSLSPSSVPTKSPAPSSLPTASPAPSSIPSQLPSQGPSVYTLPPVYNFLPAAGCRELNTEYDYWCPIERYCLWSHYPLLFTNYLFFDVGYTQFGWDYLSFPSTVDGTAWYYLPHTARQGLKMFNYDEDKHDCCNNHYWEYTWEEMTSTPGYENVTKTFEMLGYDEQSWGEEGAVTDYMDYWFEELPWEIQYALYDNLCYTPELWNEVPMMLWPFNASLPGSWNVTEYGEYVEPTYDDDDEASGFDDLFSSAFDDVYYF